MKKFFSILLLYLIVAGCRQEADVKPANESTFIRYFGSEYSHDAVLALEADEGYTLLSTITIPTDGLGNRLFKIRLIHTDRYGNTVWHKEYPSFDDVDVADVVSGDATTGGFKANSFIALNSGYLIVGDRINASGNSDLLLIEVGKNGEEPKIRTMSLNTGSLTQEALHGHAVVADGNNFVVLGSVEPANSDREMFVAKVSESYDSLWSYRYPNGDNTLINKLFYSTEKSELVWAGSVVLKGNNEVPQSDLRLVIAPQNSQRTYSGNPFGKATFNEVGADMCAYNSGYAIIGTQTSANGDKDILFSRVLANGDEDSSKSLSFIEDGDLNDEGNSICQSSTGGFALLATVDSGSKGNGKKDLYLIKTDVFGNKEWGANYGGVEDEKGSSILETSDGSYLIYGTTNFGTLQKLILIKVNNKGQL